MSGFDFQTLNSSDFEELVKDLLNAQESATDSPIVFRVFKEGRDKGIDLLYSTAAHDYEIVGQVKHYYRSGVSKLLSNLENEEYNKVKKLNPGKYIVATSLDLSVGNIQNIRHIFSPFIKTFGDVYDKKALNDLIDRFDNVLRKHFKLWFSSTKVLGQILQHAVEGRSNEFVEEELKKRLRLYVETPALQQAKSILEKNNFVIITGEPGVGKTTTAELLLYNLISQGYELIYLYDDIKEAEEALSDKKRQVVFYYDDFLGHTAVEIEKAKGAESALLRTLRRISIADNKKFIFTTRTFVFNNAVLESERLRQFNIKAKESLMALAVYNDDLKTKLLNNHIEESPIPSSLKAVLLKPEIQRFIIHHKNFSPRSVAFITSSSTLNNINPDDFDEYIKTNFNQPDEIWRHAYEQQIDSSSRLLLSTMVSFGDQVNLESLETAFNARLDYEVEHNNLPRPINAFRNAFARIENGFVVKDSHSSNIFRFINPSLIDFLVQFIKQDKQEVKRIAESVAFVDQLIERLYSLDNVRSSLVVFDAVKVRVENEYHDLIDTINHDCDCVKLALFSYYYLNNIPLTEKLFGYVDEWANVYYDGTTSALLINFLESTTDPVLIDFVKDKARQILAPLLIDVYDIEELLQKLQLASDKFAFNLTADSNLLEEISEHATSLLDEKIEEDIEQLKTYSHAQDFVSEKEEESEKLRDALELYGLTIQANFSEYNAYDWFEIGSDNYFNEQMAKDD